MKRTNKPYIEGLRRNNFKIFLGKSYIKVCNLQKSIIIDSG